MSVSVMAENPPEMFSRIYPQKNPAFLKNEVDRLFFQKNHPPMNRTAGKMKRTPPHENEVDTVKLCQTTPL